MRKILRNNWLHSVRKQWGRFLSSPGVRLRFRIHAAPRATEFTRTGKGGEAHNDFLRRKAAGRQLFVHVAYGMGLSIREDGQDGVADAGLAVARPLGGTRRAGRLAPPRQNIRQFLFQVEQGGFLIGKSFPGGVQSDPVGRREPFSCFSMC